MRFLSIVSLGMIITIHAQNITNNNMFSQGYRNIAYTFNYKTTHTFVYKKKTMPDGTFKTVPKDDRKF